MKKFVAAVFILVSWASTSSPSQARLSPQRSVLDNGLILITSEQRTLPIVTFSLLLRAGSRYDPAGREGLANLTSRLLTYGTKTRTALQISEALDFIGASLSAGAGPDVATVSMNLLKKDLDTGVDLLTDVLTASVFPPEEIDRQKQAIIASIKAKKEDPGTIAQESFSAALYPQSPYGRPAEGTEGSVRSLDRAGLVDFYQRYYRPDRAILVVVGDISHQEIVEKLGKSFRGWEKGGSGPEAPPPSTPGPTNLIRINKSLTQANIIMGHAGIPRNHPDYYAVHVMNYILGGGGFSSRLTDSVRNERGLAYSVYSTFSADKNIGIFETVMQTKNETAEEAIRIVKSEIERIRREKVTQEELQNAKDYLIGSFPLRLDTNGAVASFLTWEEFYGLGFDYPERYPDLIGGVSQEDVLRVAHQYLQPEKLIVVVVADQKKADITK